MDRTIRDLTLDCGAALSMKHKATGQSTRMKPTSTDDHRDLIDILDEKLLTFLILYVLHSVQFGGSTIDRTVPLGKGKEIDIVRSDP